MKEQESRRGVPLRAGVGLVAVAATVAAGFALANPASAAVTAPASLTLSPSSATSYDNGSATYTITTPLGDQAVAVELTTSAGAANPLTLKSGATTGTQGGALGAWTDELKLTTDTTTKTVTFTAASSATGSFTVIAGADAGVAGGGAATGVPTGNPRQTATQTVIAHNAVNPDSDVTALSVSPTSYTGYSTDPDVTVTVTATGTNGADVDGATITSSITPASGGAATSADGTTTFTYTAASLVGKSSIAYSDNGHTASVAVNVADASKIDQTAANKKAVLSTPSDANSDLIQTTGSAINVPFTVALTETDSTTHVVSPAPAGLQIGFDATYADGSQQRVVATTGADGKATATIPVAAVNAADTKTLSVQAYLGGGTSFGAGTLVGGTNAAGAAKVVTFQVSKPGIAVGDAQAVVGGTVTVPVTITDQFGKAAGAGDTVKYTVSGHNSITSTVTVGAGGKVNVTYTDTAKAGVGATETVAVDDLTHPAYDTGSGADLSATVTYVASVTPGSLTFGAPVALVGANVDDAATQAVTVTLNSDKGDHLVGQPVTITVDKGWVGGTAGVNSGKTSYVATTASGGVATFYVGSEAAGVQTFTATAGSVKAVDATTITYTALAPSVFTLTGPKSVKAGASATYTAKLADKFGNGATTSTAVTFSASDPSVLPGGISPVTASTGTGGTVSITIKAGSAAGTITATTPATGTLVAPNNTVSAAYTIQKPTTPPHHTKKTERPKISVSSRAKGKVVVTVTTHPAFKKGMVVSIYKNKHGHWVKAGHVKVDKNGRGQVTLKSASGVHLIIGAKGNSGKYIEKMSKSHKVTVK